MCFIKDFLKTIINRLLKVILLLIILSSVMSEKTFSQENTDDDKIGEFAMSRVTTFTIIKGEDLIFDIIIKENGTTMPFMNCLMQ